MVYGFDDKKFGVKRKVTQDYSDSESTISRLQIIIGLGRLVLGEVSKILFEKHIVWNSVWNYSLIILLFLFCLKSLVVVFSNHTHVTRTFIDYKIRIIKPFALIMIKPALLSIINYLDHEYSSANIFIHSGNRIGFDLHNYRYVCLLIIYSYEFYNFWSISINKIIYI